jgi:ribose transport system ATP-binding protein
MRRLDVRAGAGPNVGELSGNQQKSRWAASASRRESSCSTNRRGHRRGSKAQIYKLMGELAAAGQAVVFVSRTAELLGVRHAGVMCRGVLTKCGR